MRNMKEPGKFQIRRAWLLGTALLAFLFLQNGAWAQAWPVKPIRLIVPFPAGGPTDRIGRVLANKLGSALGQPVVVENIGGAGGTIGMARVAKAAADGYTFGLGATSTQAISTFLYDKLPYDPLTDFAPVSKVAEYTNVLLVNEKQHVKSVQELIALAKAKPGQVNYASSGNGTSSHLSGEIFQSLAKVSITHVPYKGAAAAQNDLIGGNVTFMFDVLGTAMGLAEAGKLRILASTGHARLKQFPDLPTVGETVPGYEVSGWFAVFAPRGVPGVIVERLNREIARVMHEPDIAASLTQMGYESATSTPGELHRQIEQDLRFWGPIVKSTKARIE